MMKINWIKLEPGCELPEMYDCVLLTISTLYEVFVTVGIKVNYLSKSCVYKSFTPEKRIIFDIYQKLDSHLDYKILAWAPLPEPYKEVN